MKNKNEIIIEMMNQNNILILPNIIIQEIFKFINDDQDRLSFYQTCKRLMNRKYLVLRDKCSVVSYQYPSLLNCVMELSVPPNRYFWLLWHLQRLSDTTKHEPIVTRLTIEWSSTRIMDYFMSVEQSKFNDGKDHYINHLDILPSSINTLILDDTFNQPLPSTLPTSLTSLTFGTSFNQILEQDNVLSKSTSLLHIGFGKNFNQPIEPGSLPPNLESIEFSPNSLFIKPLTELPNSIKKIKGLIVPPPTLPPLLTSLSFGVYFNAPIDIGWLPNTLEYLYFDNGFDRPLEPGSLPTSLVQLGFGSLFNHRISIGLLPDNLKILEFNSESIFNHPLPILPSNLVQLLFGWQYDQPFQIGTLPSTLRILEFDYASNFNQPLSIGILPDGLEILKFGCDFNHPLLVGSLPSNLIHLEFDQESLFNQPILPKLLPTTLKVLIFGGLFNQPLVGGQDILPSSLEVLKFGESFNQKIDYLPPRLLKLEFNDNYSHRISRSTLPCTLTLFGHPHREGITKARNKRLLSWLKRHLLYLSILFGLIVASILIFFLHKYLTKSNKDDNFK